MNRFTAHGRLYEFEILAKHSPAGMDRSCTTVKIAGEDGKQWIGQTDTANSSLTTVNSRLTDWLKWAFEHYDPAKIPDRFEIPQGIPQDDPSPHRCTVRSTP